MKVNVSQLPLIESCDGCGVCCMDQGTPPGYGVIALNPGVWPKEIGDHERFNCLPLEAKQLIAIYLDTEDRDKEAPCVWLDRDTMRCKFYEHRPHICRDFERGSDSCREYRLNENIG